MTTWLLVIIISTATAGPVNVERSIHFTKASCEEYRASMVTKLKENKSITKISAECIEQKGKAPAKPK